MTTTTINIKELQEELRKVDRILMELDTSLSILKNEEKWEEIHSLRKTFHDIEISNKYIQNQYSRLMKTRYKLINKETDKSVIVDSQERKNYSVEKYTLVQAIITKYTEATTSDDYINREKKTLLVLDLDETTMLVPYEIREV